MVRIVEAFFGCKGPHYTCSSSQACFPNKLPIQMCAFALNLAVFLLIGKTSALTMNVAGVVKDWMLIGLSVWLYHAHVTQVFDGICSSDKSECLNCSGRTACSPFWVGVLFCAAAQYNLHNTFAYTDKPGWLRPRIPGGVCIQLSQDVCSNCGTTRCPHRGEARVR